MIGVRRSGAFGSPPAGGPCVLSMGGDRLLRVRRRVGMRLACVQTLLGICRAVIDEMCVQRW
eukprot:5297072-Alexandrium_andersonii.AAC.1